MHKALIASGMYSLPMLVALVVLAVGCIRAQQSEPVVADAPQSTPPASEVESGDLVITVTFDNNPSVEDLQTGWGFSCLVRGTEKTVLFDTGANGQVLLDNMRKLQLDPKQVQVVVLSHLHGDHVGGLGEFLEANSEVTVYLPRSFSGNFKAQVRQTGAQVVEVHEPQEICPYLYTTGEMGTGILEQSLVIETQPGLVVITGCAHPGIVNIARRAKQMREKPVHLVLGGFHLSGTSASRIESIIADLQALEVEKAAPCHCSGDLARRLFAEAFGDNYLAVGVGKTLVIEQAFPPEE